jgi:osmoprotectant transport system permease protein
MSRLRFKARRATRQLLGWLLIGCLVPVVNPSRPALASDGTANPVRVGSKDFAESRLLGELFAQAIEKAGARVERRFGLAGSDLALRALVAGDIDVYPEYTGTGLVTLLHEPANNDPKRVLERVRAAFAGQFAALWLEPLGFENGWVLAIPRTLARAEGLATISDLTRVAPRLRGLFSPEFVEREDGLVGLARTYHLELGDVRSAGQSVKYQAIASGGADLIDAYSTDGRLDALGLEPLADDRRFFPPYEAVPLVRSDLASRAPGAVTALLSLGGRIDARRMRAGNAAVEVSGEPVETVAARMLAEAGLGGSTVEPTRERASLLADAWSRRGALIRDAGRHLLLTLAGLVAAVAIGLPVGVFAGRPRGAVLLAIAAVLQTIPGLALFALLVPLLGIGALPAIIALFLYALLPIVRGVAAGLAAVDPTVIDAAEGIGFTSRQVFLRVRLPLAVPVLMSGIRTAAVISVGNATLAAFVGAGGLGQPILTGLTLNDGRLILEGAVPAALLAIGVDALLGSIERAIAPRYG